MGSNQIVVRLQAQIITARRQPAGLKRDRSIFLSELMLARLQQGITQSQLAERCGLKQSAIARIEGGKVNPTLDSLLKMAAALNRNLVLE